jgi:hypothetical protein
MTLDPLFFKIFLFVQIAIKFGHVVTRGMSLFVRLLERYDMSVSYLCLASFAIGYCQVTKSAVRAGGIAPMGQTLLLLPPRFTHSISIFNIFAFNSF